MRIPRKSEVLGVTVAVISSAGLLSCGGESKTNAKETTGTSIASFGRTALNFGEEEIVAHCDDIKDAEEVPKDLEVPAIRAVFQPVDSDGGRIYMGILGTAACRASSAIAEGARIDVGDNSSCVSVGEVPVTEVHHTIVDERREIEVACA